MRRAVSDGVSREVARRDIFDGVAREVAYRLTLVMG